MNEDAATDGARLDSAADGLMEIEGYEEEVVSIVGSSVENNVGSSVDTLEEGIPEEEEEIVGVADWVAVGDKVLSTTGL